MFSHHRFRAQIPAGPFEEINEAALWESSTLYSRPLTVLIMIGNWMLFLFLAQHYRSLDDLQNTLQNFSAKKANCFSEMDRVFVNRTIRALYGSLEEFDQVIREVVAPQIMKAARSPSAEFWNIIQIMSPYYYCIVAWEIPNVVADKRLSLWLVFVFIVGQVLLAVWYYVTQTYFAMLLPIRFFRHRPTFAAWFAWWVGFSLTQISERMFNSLVSFFFSAMVLTWSSLPKQQDVVPLASWCEQHKLKSVEIRTMPYDLGKQRTFTFWEFEADCPVHEKLTKPCNPTEYLGVVLPLMLFCCVMWHNPCRRRSEFQDEEVTIKSSKPAVA